MVVKGNQLGSLILQLLIFQLRLRYLVRKPDFQVVFELHLQYPGQCQTHLVAVHRRNIINLFVDCLRAVFISIAYQVRHWRHRFLLLWLSHFEQYRFPLRQPSRSLSENYSKVATLFEKEKRPVIQLTIKTCRAWIIILILFRKENRKG
jgi:hypothetical protein